MTFDMKIKFEGRTIQKSTVENLSDFDSVMDGLKEKFGDKKEKRLI